MVSHLLSISDWKSVYKWCKRWFSKLEEKGIWRRECFVWQLISSAHAIVNLCKMFKTTEHQNYTSLHIVGRVPTCRGLCRLVCFYFCWLSFGLFLFLFIVCFSSSLFLFLFPLSVFFFFFLIATCHLPRVGGPSSWTVKPTWNDAQRPKFVQIQWGLRAHHEDTYRENPQTHWKSHKGQGTRHRWG